ncbi:putative GPI-anchored protein isoform E [Glycine soja]|uniref:Putative GPI-anchored protein isoform E n=1 Tax=Glycine soja TaxID=3848 RepID=A0A445HJ42_GLYSO|nr:putative GPI-anchored protein isoform E [Glycine soja]
MRVPAVTISPFFFFSRPPLLFFFFTALPLRLGFHFFNPIYIALPQLFLPLFNFFTSRSYTILSFEVLQVCFIAMWCHLAYHRQPPGYPV